MAYSSSGMLYLVFYSPPKCTLAKYAPETRQGTTVYENVYYSAPPILDSADNIYIIANDQNGVDRIVCLDSQSQVIWSTDNPFGTPKGPGSFEWALGSNRTLHVLRDSKLYSIGAP